MVGASGRPGTRQIGTGAAGQIVVVIDGKLNVLDRGRLSREADGRRGR
jgi:hypothetical protein